MTIKQLYDWAKNKGYENFEVICDCFNGEWPFDPNHDFHIDERGLIFEFEC